MMCIVAVKRGTCYPAQPRVSPALMFVRGSTALCHLCTPIACLYAVRRHGHILQCPACVGVSAQQAAARQSLLEHGLW